MKEEIIGKRYAKALIQLGREQSSWEQLGQDLEAFITAFEESQDLRSVLCDPVHERDKRKAILGDVLKKMEIGEVVAHFLLLLVDKERMRYLPAIYQAYRKLEDVLAGRLRAKIITAQSLPGDEVREVQQALESRFNKQIILEVTEDPEILGGIICKVDGMVFDGSVSTQLELLKETMRGE